jgi:hypothetical protein
LGTGFGLHSLRLAADVQALPRPLGLAQDGRPLAIHLSSLCRHDAYSKGLP